MTLTLFAVALAVFLAGFCAGIYAVLVISIHRAARAPFLTFPQRKRPGGIARVMLIGVRDKAGTANEQNH